MEKDCRPWGYYEVLSDAADHKVKRIVVYPGQRLSLQRHQKRAEHWFVIRGAGVVTLDGADSNLETGKAIDITRGAWHRIRNQSGDDMAFIEVQTGEYFGEDDIERLADDYGRI
jgi:mannose-6-phosphate isomerase